MANKKVIETSAEPTPTPISSVSPPVKAQGATDDRDRLIEDLVGKVEALTEKVTRSERERAEEEKIEAERIKNANTVRHSGKLLPDISVPDFNLQWFLIEHAYEASPSLGWEKVTVDMVRKHSPDAIAQIAAGLDKNPDQLKDSDQVKARGMFLFRRGKHMVADLENDLVHRMEGRARAKMHEAYSHKEDGGRIYTHAGEVDQTHEERESQFNVIRSPAQITVGE